MGRVTCEKCGAKIELPAGFDKPKVRCTDCGYYTEVPADKRSETLPGDPPSTKRSGTTPPAERPGDYRINVEGRTRSDAANPTKPTIRVKRSIDPRDHRPKFEADEPTGPPLLEGTQDFDDDKPYAVPGIGTTKCPYCRQELPLDAKLCVHCGRDVASGRKAGRKYQSIDRTWVEGWPLQLRLKVLAGAQVVNVIGSILALLNVDDPGFTDLFWSFAFAVMHGAMLAFVIGTFDTLTVRRTGKGTALLTRVRWIGFVPLPAEKVAWKESHGVGTLPTHDVGFVAWIVFAYLLMLCILPGAVFYWMVIRPEQFQVILCDVHGGTDSVIFRAHGREDAEEAAKVISDATGLWHKTAF